MTDTINQETQEDKTAEGLSSHTTVYANFDMHVWFVISRNTVRGTPYASRAEAEQQAREFAMQDIGSEYGVAKLVRAISVKAITLKHVTETIYVEEKEQ